MAEERFMKMEVEVGGQDLLVEGRLSPKLAARVNDVDGGDPAEGGEFEIDSVRLVCSATDTLDITDLIEELSGFEVILTRVYEELDR